MLLQASGHHVRVAIDGLGALQAALAWRPDVLLLDIGLPGLSGFEVARRIREENALKGVVLIAVTGYSEESGRRLSQQAGFDHHLVKPPDFAVLKEILASVALSAAKPAKAA